MSSEFHTNNIHTAVLIKLIDTEVDNFHFYQENANNLQLMDQRI
jgi:hypothetical protein